MKRFVLKGRGIKPEYRIPYEQELNPEQLAVVMAGEGPLLVIAGAGSGKTRTLTYRVARLVESGVPPEAILLLTFTNKAAREMLARVEALLGTSGLRVVGGTFHHVGNLVLRRHAPTLGFPHSFTILDSGDVRDLMRQVAAAMGLEARARRAAGGVAALPSADVLVSALSFAVNTLRSVEEVIEEKYPMWAAALPDIGRVLAGYRDKKRAIGAMDYDDLLLSWLALMQGRPELEQDLKGRYAYVLVDEYQDTNRLQGILIDTLAALRRNLTVVGDDAQSIYAFRGAHHKNILTFPERYPDAEVFRLVTNYRSQPQILHLANASIAVNTEQFPKELRAVRPPGEKPLLARCRDVYQQAALVAEYVLSLVDEGRALSDIACLYRANYQSLEIQAELTRRHVPFVVYGGIRFFEQAHVKDAVSYLRVVCNGKDELAWMRLLPLCPKLGQRSAAKVTELLLAAPEPLSALGDDEVRDALPRPARGPFAELGKLLRTIAERREAGPADLLAMAIEGHYEPHLQEKFPNWRNRREDLQQLMAYAGSFKSTGEFLSELALLGSTQSETVMAGGEDAPEGTLTLATVHQAKGLEWPCVIIAGLSDGAFPSALSLREASGEEEERRLFYVAVTRAKDELLLSFPATRVVRGQGLVVQKPSRFLCELPSGVREEMEVADGPGRELPPASLRRQLPAGDEGFSDPDLADEAYFDD